jgi:hypothetical protein
MNQKIESIKTYKYREREREREREGEIEVPVKSFEILLLSDLEENLHGVSVIVDFGEPREVPLDLIPLSGQSLLFEVFHVEEEPRLLLQPMPPKRHRIQNPKTRPEKRNSNNNNKEESYLCTVSLNFSSSRNWRIRNTNSLLKDDIFAPTERAPTSTSKKWAFSDVYDLRFLQR